MVILFTEIGHCGGGVSLGWGVISPDLHVELDILIEISYRI